MPPNYGPDYVKQFDAMYPELARKYKVPLLPFILQDVYGVEGKMSDDGIHPNGLGYQVVAHNILPVLLPLLKKQG
jgi:acyl-CoA thioesterase-1